MVYTALACARARRPRALAALQLDQPAVARAALPVVVRAKLAFIVVIAVSQPLTNRNITRNLKLLRAKLAFIVITVSQPWTNSVPNAHHAGLHCHNSVTTINKPKHCT